MDITKLIKDQSAKTVEELKVLSSKLSEQLRNVINLIPENTRQKSVEDFLNSIRESVFSESPKTPKAQRKYTRRTKKATTPETAPKKVMAKKRAKKAKAQPEAEGEEKKA